MLHCARKLSLVISLTFSIATHLRINFIFIEFYDNLHAFYCSSANFFLFIMISLEHQTLSLSFCISKFKWELIFVYFGGLTFTPNHHHHHHQLFFIICFSCMSIISWISSDFQKMKRGVIWKELRKTVDESNDVM